MCFHIHLRPLAITWARCFLRVSTNVCRLCVSTSNYFNVFAIYLKLFQLTQFIFIISFYLIFSIIFWWRHRISRCIIIRIARRMLSMLKHFNLFKLSRFISIISIYFHLFQLSRFISIISIYFNYLNLFDIFLNYFNYSTFTGDLNPQRNHSATKNVGAFSVATENVGLRFLLQQKTPSNRKRYDTGIYACLLYRLRHNISHYQPH